MTFLLSGMPSKNDVEDLTELIELHGGEVEAEVPPPETPDNFTSSPEVGARMSQFAAPPRRARVRMRVITPKPGRTLKHLYAAAVGAPLLKPY